MSPLDLDALLVGGGDERLALDSVSGLNLYGHGPLPRPGDLAMGSSTASTISARAYRALARAHPALLEQIRREGDIATYRAGLASLRARLQAVLGLGGPGAHAAITFSPSGTDLHLLAATLLAGTGPALLTITLEGSETGSGVGTASAGRHFMQQAPDGTAVAKGAPVGRDQQSLALVVRDEAGELVCPMVIEQQLDALIGAAIRAGRDCLLVVGDVTKTGLIAPDLDTVFRLKARYGARLWIMVDACQLRVSAQTIRAYLAQGMMVAITGSKFMGGPVFSGALLCPPGVSRRLSGVRLPVGMGAYFGQEDLPEGWAMRADLPARANLGLLLRWQAALLEWEQLHALDAEAVAGVIHGFAAAVQARLAQDPGFAPLATRALDRGALYGAGDRGSAIDSVPTIFPFLLRRLDAAGRPVSWLEREDTCLVYQHLAEGAVSGRRIRLGQPVACGMRAGLPVSALRLCLSAGLIVDACGQADGQQRLLDAAMLALDGAAQAARHLGAAAIFRKSA